MNHLVMRAYVATGNISQHQVNATKYALIEASTVIFDGATAWEGVGGWKEPDTGHVVVEPYIIIEVIIGKEYIRADEDRDRWHDAVNDIASALDQKYVLFTTSETQSALWEVD